MTRSSADAGRRIALAAATIVVIVCLVTVAGLISTGEPAHAQEPTTTAPTVTAPTTTEVDTGTVPSAEDGTGTALRIGALFIGLILAGVVGAKLWPQRDAPDDADDTSTESEVDEPADPQGDTSDQQPDATAPSRPPIVFDQDRTDGRGWPLPGKPSNARTGSTRREQHER